MLCVTFCIRPLELSYIKYVQYALFVKCIFWIVALIRYFTLKEVLRVLHLDAISPGCYYIKCYEWWIKLVYIKCACISLRKCRILTTHIHTNGITMTLIWFIWNAVLNDVMNRLWTSLVVTSVSTVKCQLSKWRGFGWVNNACCHACGSMWWL
jgi:hypothetical protein